MQGTQDLQGTQVTDVKGEQELQMYRESKSYRCIGRTRVTDVQREQELQMY